MKYKIELTDEQLDWLNNALIGACFYQIEFLKNPKCAENGGRNPFVCGVRDTLIRYLTLRRILIFCMAQAEGRDKPPVVDHDDAEYWMIVSAWNQEIKRLREVRSENG